jgi:hypothetical protein
VGVESGGGGKVTGLAFCQIAGVCAGFKVSAGENDMSKPSIFCLLNYSIKVVRKGLMGKVGADINQIHKGIRVSLENVHVIVSPVPGDMV